MIPVRRIVRGSAFHTIIVIIMTSRNQCVSAFFVASAGSGAPTAVAFVVPE